VRAKLREYRRVRGVRQVQARALRLRGEEGLDGEAGRSLCVENIIRACDYSLTGLRDAALLSTAYDAGLRVSELTGAETGHLRTDRKTGEGRLFLPQSKTDQEKAGHWAWLSAPTMQLIARWRKAGGIGSGPLFRRVRAGVSRSGERTRETVGTDPLTTEGVAHLLRSAIRRAVAAGYVALDAAELAKVIRSVSTHSFRVGLTQDLYAAGGDTNAIMQSLRWKSPGTALSYSRELAATQGAAARLLRDRRQPPSGTSDTGVGASE
jgi:integrase